VSVYIKSVYKHYTAADMKVTERLTAWHTLTNTVCERLLNAKVTWQEQAQGVAASLRDFPMT